MRQSASQPYGQQTRKWAWQLPAHESCSAKGTWLVLTMAGHKGRSKGGNQTLTVNWTTKNQTVKGKMFTLETMFYWVRHELNDQKLSMFNNQSILWVCVEFILRVLSTAAHQEDIWSGQASTTAATTKHQTCRCLCQKSSRTLEGTYWRVANTLHYISNLYKECQHCLMTECQTTDVHVCQSRTWPDM